MILKYKDQIDQSNENLPFQSVEEEQIVNLLCLSLASLSEGLLRKRLRFDLINQSKLKLIK